MIDTLLKRNISCDTKTISILMSTYNGEKYIEDQIKSILSQTYNSWVLYVRDDGSKDSTISIVSEYAEKHENIVLIDSGVNVGPLNSFLWLMKNIKSNYYMFCDQDDVWLPEKLEVSMHELSTLTDKGLFSGAAVVYSDTIVVDEIGVVISKSMWSYTMLKNIMYPDRFLYITPLVTGCTMLFNDVAKVEALKYSDFALMHDSLVSFVTLAKGGRIRAIHLPLVQYRQHANNVLGTDVFDTSVINRIRNYQEIFSNTVRYFRFVNSVTQLSFWKFMRLKIEAGLRIRNIMLGNWCSSL